MSEERAYLRRFADAAGTLAEMAMTESGRYAVYYDADEEEWIVVRQWRERIAGLLDEEDVARHTDFVRAVEMAYERRRAGKEASR